MRKQGMESGRSMLEMVAVLVIILLLTLGGLTGYNYLVQRFRRQESVKEVAELVMSVKTAALTRKHNAGATIAAREIVQGPQLDDKGQVIKLPEGENSFAVVTNLTGGAFAVTLQVEPGTCQEILRTLKNEDITMFLPSDKKITDRTIAHDAEAWAEGSRVQEIMGVKYNVEETEEDKKLVDSGKGAELRNKIMAACAGDDGLGRAAWVFDCSKGSSSYGYLYDLFCSGCPVGTMKDANGACCSYASADRCGNLCSCPKGTMCDTGKEKCVECATIPNQGVGNAACKNKYNEFKRHICREEDNKCIECLKPEDCKNTKGYDDSGDYLPSYEYCYDHKCVNCNMNYDGSNTSEDHYPCLDPNKPLCDKGICKACPENKKVWNPVKNVCTVCYDSQPGNGKDEGCKTDPKAPICVTVPVRRNDGTNTSGDSCGECLEDANCTYDPKKPVCNKMTNMCERCPDDKPVWHNGACRTCVEVDPDKPVWYNDACVHCYDSVGNGASNQYDAGCKDGRICVNGNDASKWVDNGKGTVGTKCVGCFHYSQCATDYDTCDPSKTAKVCDTSTYTCKKCGDVNSRYPWRWKSNYGTGAGCNSCYECIKNADCTGDKKACYTRTTRSPSGDNTCKKCVDTSDARSTPDNGCSSGAPICRVTTKGTAGSVCDECTSDSDCQNAEGGKTRCEKKDTGNVCACPTGRYWDTSKKTCLECNGNYQSGAAHACGSAKPVCNANGMCETCPSGKFWDTNKKKCAECNGNYQSGASHACGSAKPVCNNSGMCETCPSGKFWDTSKKACVECNGHYQSGASHACGSSKPYCHGGTCKTCPQVGAKNDAGVVKKYFGKNSSGKLGCFVCIDDKNGTNQDTGCTSGKPVCGSNISTHDGKGHNSCSAGCAAHASLVSGKCVCDAGYSGDGATGCTACPKGQYKSTAGNFGCSSCSCPKTTKGTASTSCDETYTPPRRKCGSHVSHGWLHDRGCKEDCGTNTHEKADKDNKNEPHTHYYCYCNVCDCP